jgi:hypothetical protein
MKTTLNFLALSTGIFTSLEDREPPSRLSTKEMSISVNEKGEQHGRIYFASDTHSPSNRA